MKNKKILLQKISSVLKNTGLPQEVEITNSFPCNDGDALVVEALKSQKSYGEIELTDGRMSKIHKGDLIAGVLGERKGLEGIVGKLPDKIAVGDTLSILNLGGVIGVVESWNKDFISSPLPVKVIGSILKKKNILNMHDGSLKKEKTLKKSAPIILVLGSGMGVGKTTVATEIIHLLVEKKKKVAAGKLTGVATQRDILGMKDAGAIKVLSFLDVGLSSTVHKNNEVIISTNTIINQLNKICPDYIVIELGDGVMGWYGVDTLLKNKAFMSQVAFVIACTHDIIGACGVAETLEHVGSHVDFFAGPVANTTAGSDYLEKNLHIPSQDIRNHAEKFVQTIAEKGVVSL